MEACLQDCGIDCDSGGSDSGAHSARTLSAFRLCRHANQCDSSILSLCLLSHTESNISPVCCAVLLYFEMWVRGDFRTLLSVHGYVVPVIWATVCVALAVSALLADLLPWWPLPIIFRLIDSAVMGGSVIVCVFFAASHAWPFKTRALVK
eukprot:m.163529 g.163529  ORF g.163529 m.163529 type:complete len:150 (-) comp53087_c0_seq15:55-504(-)